MSNGKWYWIPDRPQSKPPFDWQERMPVTKLMRKLYCDACTAYDNSDGSEDALSFEEVVILTRWAENANLIEEMYEALKGLTTNVSNYAFRFYPEQLEAAINALAKAESR